MITLDSGQKYIIIAPLVRHSASKAGAIVMMTSMKKCSRIVDGRYCHEAIMLLMDRNVSSAGFQWNVMLVQPGLALERYRQFARMQSSSHS